MTQQLAYAGPPAATDSRSVDDLYRMLGIVGRGWRYVAASVLVCMTVTVFFVARVKPVYKAAARLLILQQGGRPVRITSGDDPFQSPGSEDYLPTHVAIIRSPLIVEDAIRRSGFKHLNVADVLRRMHVTLPEPGAKILEITYQAESRLEAKSIVDAVIASYRDFLDQNFQKNTNEVIALITKAKDELDQEVRQLEKNYLDFRKAHPLFAVTEDGRSLVVRKIDKWDSASNDALLKEMQLHAQLDLGRKLVSEGMGLWSVAGALRMLGGAEILAPSDNATAGDGSVEQLETQLAEVEVKRQTSERLLEHLRTERQDAARARVVPEEDVMEAFLSEPEAAALRQRLALLRERYDNSRRVVKNAGDPTLTMFQRRIQGASDDLKKLWEKRRPVLERLLSRGSTEELDALVRRAEAERVQYRSLESVLRERLAPLETERTAALVKADDDDDTGIRKLGSPRKDPSKNDGQAQVLLTSIERSLEAIRGVRAQMRARFEEDLAASKDTELDRLTEAKLRGDLERHKLMFASVVDQLKQAQLAKDYSTISAKMLHPPSVANASPMAALVLFAALVFGTALGVGCAYLADMLDARIRTLPEIRRAFELPVLGMIPQLSRDADDVTAEMGLVSHAMPRSLVAESYKSIRTKLEFHRRNRTAQVILIASPHSGDGKSTTASNLAISLAHLGRKVLLIDADLRRASQHHTFGLGRERGLVQILKDLLPPSAVIQSTPILNLDLLSAGPEVPNPAELLASPRLGEFLKQARETYEVVIVDSPPILAVTDPSVIAGSVDGIVLVVRASTIKRHEAEQTMEILGTLGTAVLGTVINGVTREYGRYGYGYTSGYGYGGYGNGVDGNGVDATKEMMRSLERTSSRTDAERGSGAPPSSVIG